MGQQPILGKKLAVMKTDRMPRNRTDLTRRPRQGKRHMRIGTWNVLSWYRTGAASQTIQELEKIGMDITAIQEMRWPDSGDMKISKSHIFYSGTRDGTHQFGTGFVIKESLTNNVIAFKPINERICYLRIRTIPYNVSIISTHAPTEEKDDLIKDAFYDELESLILQTPKQDMMMLCGDFNAQIGKERNYIPTIGMHSLHIVSNDNGTRLVQLAASTNMLIKSTMFEHKNIHKQTWISNDGVTKNQIDHIVVDARHGTNVLDVRSMRGALADTDHILVRTQVKLRLSCKKNYRAEKLVRYDTTKFKQPQTLDKYQKYLADRLHAEELEGHTNSIEEQWQTLKTVISGTAKECLGEKKKNKKAWYDEECKLLNAQKGKARAVMLQDPSEANINKYRELRRHATRMNRQKKRMLEQEMFTDMETNLNQHKSREFFTQVSNLKTGFRPRSGQLLKREDDSIISGTEEILAAWRQHFNSLLNTRETEEQASQIYHTVDRAVDDPTLEEVTRAMKKIKNNKAPGKDGIPAECLKYGGEILHQRIHKLIKCIWREEQLPEEWKECVIIPLHKKGDRMKCENYRGISLINVTYKVLANIILDRLTPLVDSCIGDYQCGFRRHRSTVDQIFTIRQMLEKTWEFNQELHNLFIDFRQAYDSILRVELWNAMTELSIPQKLIRLTRKCVEGSSSVVRVGNALSTPFLINTGLKQGDAMSPLLFNIALEKAVRSARIDMQMFTADGPRLLLAFADDIDIVGRTTIKVKEQFIELEKETKKMGLNINEIKTKYMCVTRQGQRGRIRDRIGQNVTIGEFNFERVQSFKYLGATLNADNDILEEIKTRILSGNRCMYALNKAFQSKNLSRKSKVLLYRTVIRPIIMYASETWTLTKASEYKLLCFERKILRRIFGPLFDPETQRYRIRTNRELNQLYQDPDIVREIKSRRLRWAGHVQRQSDERLVKLVWQSNPQARRPPGRPRLRWRDNIKSDLEAMGYEMDTQLMTNREEWRQIVRSAKTHQGL